ncbi:MAG TPA: beta-ketoacyl-ACP synthase II [Terrimicrobiaceae bacterium]|nr:beta-ketoacyl-ACP synthase II [Terrimicrobiaceae bacterium]
MSERRVVVTGIGVISPVGNDIDTFWKNLTEGRSGVSRYEAFDSSIYDCKIAGEVRNFEPAQFFKSPKDARRADRFTQFAMAASKTALADSGISLEHVDHDRFGVMIGSGIGGLKSMEDECRRLFERGPSRVSPFTIAMMISNMASGLVSMEYGLRGPNMSIVTACATANHSIGEAWRMIKFDDADCFIAGGTEATITPLGISGFAAMRAMSLRNDDPERASRPFDKDRDGFVMGEGAGIVLLEELEHAKKRGAHIYCELSGYGLSADAFHMTQPLPDGEGAARCMRLAMKHAKVNPEDIDYINAHGTSTPIGDVCETKAIKQAVGDHAKKVMVSSTKSMTGHLLGAAGGVEFAVCALSIKHGVIPPTINLDDPDPECDLDYVPKTAREAKVKVAMSNSFGFGGHNATLIASEFTG